MPPFYQENHDLITLVATLPEDAFITGSIYLVNIFLKRKSVFVLYKLGPLSKCCAICFTYMDLLDDACSEVSAFLANNLS